MPDFIYHKGARPSIGADRDEVPVGNCLNDFWAFDEMLEHRPDSKAWTYARDAAADVCAPCPKRATCEFAVEGDAA